MTASLRAYGPGECNTEVKMLHQMVTLLKQDLQLQTAQQQVDEQIAEEEACASWPSAVAARGAAGGAALDCNSLVRL